MEREERRRPPKRGGINPMIVLLGAILAIAGLVIFVNSGAAGDEKPEETASEDAFDPFSSVPAEERPPSRTGKPAASSSDDGKQDMATAPDPFSSLGGFQSDPIWKAAEAKAKEAEELLSDAMTAHLDGDSKTAKEKGKRSQTLFTEALHSTLPLEESLRKKHGNESNPVARIGRLRQNWNRSVMTLKKAAFL